VLLDPDRGLFAWASAPSAHRFQGDSRIRFPRLRHIAIMVPVQTLEILRNLLVVYGTGLIVVYLFQKIKQPPVAGFLLAGVLAGPYGLALITDLENVQVLADIGVMVLLFSLGLEFSLKKMGEIRHIVLGSGFLQVAGTFLAVMLLGRYFGLPFELTIVLGFMVAPSSTALIIKMLSDRGEIDSIHGKVSLGVSIFQDLCTIPMIVLIPLIAGLAANNSDEIGVWTTIARLLITALAVIIGAVVMARYLFPAFLNIVIQTRNKELFVVSLIVMFLGTAWLIGTIGFSLALGAFLAGLILSESEYSSQIFADMRPFRDGLNSLFFIAIGMLANPRFAFDEAGLVIVLVLLVLVLKAVIAGLAVLAAFLPLQVALLAGFLLAQIGEFSFVLLQAGATAGVINDRWYQLGISVAFATMVVTPAVFKLARGLVSRDTMRRLHQTAIPADLVETGRTLHDHVILCGYGASGKKIAPVLRENGIPYLILELNARTVREERANGEPICFGDCTNAEILRRTGIREARIILFAISDPFSTRQAVKIARTLNKDLIILTRTKYLADINELYELGANEVIAEEFEASLELMTRILRVYHVPRAAIAGLIRQIRTTRFGVFRDGRPTVPRLRLSGQLDVYTETVEVTEQSPIAHRHISESDLRSRSGALILGIMRGTKTINNPHASEQILPGDHLILTGTKDQLNHAIGIVTGEVARSLDRESERTR
jgi:monovalent cation:H+ antiporter-2, CPA2 family